MVVFCDPDPGPKMVGGGEVVAKMIRMILMIVILLPSLKTQWEKRVAAAAALSSHIIPD